MRPRHGTIGSLTAARRLRHEFTPRPARSTNRPRLRISVRDAARELHDRPRAVLQWAEPRDAALLGAQSLGRALQGRAGCAAGRPASATAEALQPNARGWQLRTCLETWTASSAPRCDQNATGCASSGGAIRASPAGRSCWSPPMRRPVEHGQRGKASSSMSSTATFRRSRIACRWIWARMSRGLISDDDFTAQACATAQSDYGGEPCIRSFGMTVAGSCPCAAEALAGVFGQPQP